MNKNKKWLGFFKVRNRNHIQKGNAKIPLTQIAQPIQGKMRAEIQKDKFDDFLRTFSLEDSRERIPNMRRW